MDESDSEPLKKLRIAMDRLGNMTADIVHTQLKAQMAIRKKQGVGEDRNRSEDDGVQKEEVKKEEDEKDGGKKDEVKKGKANDYPIDDEGPLNGW